jgi:hypothetical protein
MLLTETISFLLQVKECVPVEFDEAKKLADLTMIYNDFHTVVEILKRLHDLVEGGYPI